MSDYYTFEMEPPYLVTPLVRMDSGEPVFCDGLGRWAKTLDQAKEFADSASRKDGCMYLVFARDATLHGSTVVCSHEVYRTPGGPMCKTITNVY